MAMRWFAGDYREGASILQRAVDASSAHPTWWDYGLFLAEFMLGDMDKARGPPMRCSCPRNRTILPRASSSRSRAATVSRGALAAELGGTYPTLRCRSACDARKGQLSGGLLSNPPTP